MNTTSKQQKLFNKAKNTIKKLSKDISLKMAYTLLGMFLCVVIVTASIYLVYSAPAGESWPTLQVGVNVGDLLTIDKWNGLINKIDELEGRTIAIETGVLSHGQTIPLPSGFTQDKCKWFVSLNKIVEFEHANHSNDETFYVSVNSNRKVYVRHYDGASGWGNGKVNYLIICQ